MNNEIKDISNKLQNDLDKLNNDKTFQRLTALEELRRLYSVDGADPTTFKVKNSSDDFLKQYVKNAIRTESRLSELKINKDLVIKLFSMYTNLGDILDGLKKSVFYNKNEKLLTTLNSNLDSIAGTINEIKNISNEQIVDDHEKTVIPNIDPRVFHGILGLMTESSEGAEIIEKLLLDETSVIDPVNVQEECQGDVGWYTAILSDALDMDWKQGLTNNIDKLRVRFPSAYSHNNATDRDLTSERKELEKGKNKAW